MNYKRLGFYVREKDVSVNDNLRYATILDYFQDIAAMQADEIGMGFKDVVKKNYLWILLYITFEVKKRIPSFGEEVDVITWPKEKGRIEYEREYEIRDKKTNEVLITGLSNWCLIDATSRTIRRAEINYEGEMYQNHNYTIRCPHKIGLVEHDILKEYDYKVLKTDLDHNFHMNNARYLDIIYNMDAENRTDFKKVDIAFIHEAKLGEIIHVKYYKEEDLSCYVGYVNGERCFEVTIKY